MRARLCEKVIADADAFVSGLALVKSSELHLLWGVGVCVGGKGESVYPVYRDPLRLRARGLQMLVNLGQTGVHVVVHNDGVQEVSVLSFHANTLINRAPHVFLLVTQTQTPSTNT